MGFVGERMRFHIRHATLGLVASLGLGCATAAHADTLVTLTGILPASQPQFGANTDQLGLFGPAGALLQGDTATIQFRVPTPSNPGLTVELDDPADQALLYGGPNSVIPGTVTLGGVTRDCAAIGLCDPNQPTTVTLAVDPTLGNFLDIRASAVLGVPTGPDTARGYIFGLEIEAYGLPGVANPLDLSSYNGLSFSWPDNDPNAPNLFGDIYFNVADYYSADYTTIDSFSTAGQFTGGTISFQAVPEPATWALMIAGFGLAGAALRRRRRAQSA